MNRKQYLYESNKKVRQRKLDMGLIRWEIWIKPEWKPDLNNKIKELQNDSTTTFKTNNT